MSKNWYQVTSFIYAWYDSGTFVSLLTISMGLIMWIVLFGLLDQLIWALLLATLDVDLYVFYSASNAWPMNRFCVFLQDFAFLHFQIFLKGVIGHSHGAVLSDKLVPLKSRTIIQNLNISANYTWGGWILNGIAIMLQHYQVKGVCLLMLGCSIKSTSPWIAQILCKLYVWFPSSWGEYRHQME